MNVSAQFDSKARGQLNIMFLSWLNVSAQFDSKARVLLTITLLEDSTEKAENMATRSLCMIQGLIFESLCKNVL